MIALLSLETLNKSSRLWAKPKLNRILFLFVIYCALAQYFIVLDWTPWRKLKEKVDIHTATAELNGLFYLSAEPREYHSLPNLFLGYRGFCCIVWSFIWYLYREKLTKDYFLGCNCNLGWVLKISLREFGFGTIHALSMQENQKKFPRMTRGRLNWSNGGSRST